MIFFGAGVSAPFGIPTTPALTKETVDLLSTKSTSLLTQINQSHNEQWGIEPNYEEILGYLTAYVNPSELRGDDYRISFANRNPQFRGEQNYKMIEGLIDQIHEIVCNYCNQPFIKEANTDRYLKPDDLESKFQMIYDAIVGTYLSFVKPHVIFSTNYDPSLEIWCLKRNIECIDGTQRTANIEVNKVLDEAGHKEQLKRVFYVPDHGRQPSTNVVGLVRLHGSVWTYDIKEKIRIKFTTPPDRRIFSDMYRQTIGMKPSLIFPGQEDNVSRGQWDILYQYFKESLSDNCLFVGYSFRHEVFNRPILDNLQNGKLKLLGVLSPHAKKGVENLLKGANRFSDRIVTMEAELGKTDAVEELVQKWFPKAIPSGFDIKSAFSLLNHLKSWKKTRDMFYIK
jgi:hypothetical protein